MQKKFLLAALLVVTALVITAYNWMEKREADRLAFINSALDNRHADVQTFLADGMNVNARGEYDVTALMAASYRGHSEMVKLLLQAGADPNLTDKSGYTPLHFAVANRHVEITQDLLEHQADPSLADHIEGRAPLATAAMHFDSTLLQILLEAGAEPNHQQKNGLTALHWAVLNLQTENIRLLLHYGADVHLTEHNNHSTALHLAAESGAVELVPLLLEAGSDRTAKGRSGRTPLDVAKEKHHREIVELLES